MKNYLEFEKEIKTLEEEVDNLKSPFEPKEKKKEAANIEIFQEDETKKLFRRAAVQTHPDKHGGAYEDVFKDIAKAKHEGHLNKMLDGARKVNVKPKEISIDQIEDLEKEVYELEKKIDEITYSVHWVWYHANNAQKENILETVLNHQGTVRNSTTQEIIKLFLVLIDFYEK